MDFADLDPRFDGQKQARAQGLHDTADVLTRAYVLHPDIKMTKSRRLPEHGLAEAVALAMALPGIDLIGSEVVRLPRMQPSTLFGSGKVEELKIRFKADEIDLVLVDGPVTPVQQRNMEKEWGVKLLDRTGLILEIFADRARTREGVLQVELAALSYQRTRLVRAWTHLERQRGGFGFVGGPGETQIESDRRAIDDQMIRLRRQLDRVVKTRELHRAARRKVPFPLVAVVGYTNAGKSTLFNRMTGAQVLAKDMLFATLDPTMRGIVLADGRKIIASDTVGFISDLPTQLVAAFRATLEEVLEADLILHVRDISHPETSEQAADVQDILNSLGVSTSVPIIEVWNKLDLLPPAQVDLLNDGKRADVYPISALTGAGVDALADAISAAFDQIKTEADLTLGFDQGRAHAWLHAQGLVQTEAAHDAGWQVHVLWSARDEARFKTLV